MGYEIPRGSIVVLCGPIAVGKTRLAHEMMDAGADENITLISHQQVLQDIMEHNLEERNQMLARFSAENDDLEQMKYMFHRLGESPNFNMVVAKCLERAANVLRENPDVTVIFDTCFCEEHSLAAFLGSLKARHPDVPIVLIKVGTTYRQQVDQAKKRSSTVPFSLHAINSSLKAFLNVLNKTFDVYSEYAIDIYEGSRLKFQFVS